MEPYSRQRKKEKRKLVVGQGSWRTELNEELWVKEEPVKEERFSTGIHLNKISNFWTVSPYTQFYIPFLLSLSLSSLSLSLSLSQFEERLKTKEKKTRKTSVFMHYSFMIYLTR